MPDQLPLPLIAHLQAVYGAYASLLSAAQTSEPLGGRLLYAGNLDEQAAVLVRAANIAGAASLAAGSDALAMRQALRDGVIDFLVNSLDEALRILKNEIRKRQPVAVGVSLGHEQITQEMIDRGVLPDLLPHESIGDSAALSTFVAQGAKPLPASLIDPARPLQIWPIPIAYTNRPTEFEAILAAHLAPEDQAGRRWLHFSSRYLAPSARRYRSLPMGEETKEKLAQQFGPPLKF